MKFDVEADISGFTSAMQSVQDSVMTTYEKIEKQNKALDDALAQGMKDVQDALKNTGDELKELEKNHKDFEESLDKVAAAMDEAFDAGDTAAYEQYKAQLEAGNKVLEEQAAEIDAVKAKMDEYRQKEAQIVETTEKVSAAREKEKDTLVDLLGGQEKYNTIVSALPPALQSSQGGIMNMVKAAKAFIATPFGIVIAGIAAALKAIMSYFTSTVEGEQKFAQVTGYLSGIMAKLNDVLVKVGEYLVKMFTDPKEAIKDFKDFLVENITNRIVAMSKAISLAGDLLKDLFNADWDKMKEDAKSLGDQMLTVGTGVEDVTGKVGDLASKLHETGVEMGNLAAREKKLELDRSKWSVEKAALEAKRNEIMEKMYEGTYEEQLAAAQEAISINNKIAAQDKKLAKEAYEIIKTRNSLASSNTKDLTAENAAAAELNRVDAEASAANRRLARQTQTIAKSIREANLTLTEQQADALKQITRQEQDNELAAAQATIDAMNEGARKKEAQRKLNHDRQMIQIQRQEEDTVKAARDAAKAAWKANTENSNKTFDDSILQKTTGADYESLSANDKAVVDNYVKAVKAAQAKAASEMSSEESKFFNVDDLLDQYKDFDAKRRDIEDKYAADRERMNDAYQKAVASGNIQMANTIKNALKDLDMGEAKDKMQNALDALKADPAFINAFQDLKKVSTETLDNLLQRLEENKQALANLDPEQMKVLTDLMNNMEAEILDRSDAFDAYAVSVEKLKAAEEAKAQADAKLQKAQDAYNVTVKVFGKDSIQARQQMQLLAQAQTEALQASNDHTTALNDSKKAFAKVVEITDAFMNNLEEIGNVLGEEAGQVIGLVKDIYDFTKGTIEAVKQMTDTSVKAMSAMEKAVVILAIISAAIKVFQKLDEILNKFSDSSAYDKAVEKQKSLNKLTDAVNDYTLAIMKAENEERNWFGDSALSKLKTNADEMQQVYENYYAKLYEQQVAYRNKTKNDDNWTVTLGKFIDPTVGTTIGASMLMGMDNTYQAAYKSAVDNLRIETQSRKKSFMGIGGRDQETDDLRTWAKQKFKADLFDADGWINGTLAQQIIDSYGDKLQGETQETLEQLMALKEQYDEYMKQLKDYVSDLYQPLVENFTQSIMDWLDTGKDALDSFQQYASEVFRNIVQDMLNTIVLDKVVGTFQDDILDLYTKYSEGGLTEEDLLKKVAVRTNEMVSTYEEQIPVLEAIASNMQSILEETAGVDITNTNTATASQGISASFSQSSIDEANGRMASLQMGQQAQIEAITSIAVSIPSLVATVGDSNAFLSDIRDLAGVRNSVLADMYERMGVLQRECVNKLSDIADNTKNL